MSFCLPVYLSIDRSMYYLSVCLSIFVSVQWSKLSLKLSKVKITTKPHSNIGTSFKYPILRKCHRNNTSLICLQANDVPFSVQTSSSLLTHKSQVYRTSIVILGCTLGTFVILGLIWEWYYQRKTKKSVKYGTEIHGKHFNVLKE